MRPNPPPCPGRESRSKIDGKSQVLGDMGGPKACKNYGLGGPGGPKIVKNEGLGGLWGPWGEVLGALGPQGAKK